MEINDDLAKAIADEIEMGMKCFVNKDTLDLVCFPDQEIYLEFEENDWIDEIAKIENSPGNFILIERMNSTESFRCMEWFIEDLENKAAKEKLTEVISGRKPFAGFNMQLNMMPELINDWRAFKASCLLEHIKEQLSGV